MDPSANKRDLSHDIRDIVDFEMYPIYNSIFEETNVQLLEQLTGGGRYDVQDALSVAYSQLIGYAHLDMPQITDAEPYTHQVNQMALVNILEKMKQNEVFKKITEDNRDAWAQYDKIPDRPSGVNYSYRNIHMI